VPAPVLWAAPPAVPARAPLCSDPPPLPPLCAIAGITSAVAKSPAMIKDLYAAMHASFLL
jgi:hypothetical protein